VEVKLLESRPLRLARDGEDDGPGGLDIDWAPQAPAPPAACRWTVSARFVRTASFGRDLSLHGDRDDGVRLYVDDALRLDRWLDQAPTTYSVDVALSAGAHAVRLDYYENAGGALAKLAWAKTGGGGGTSGSKLTIHTSFTGGLSMAFVRDAKPRLLKILDNFGPAAG
jgi:hypothetical protein